MFLLSPTLYLSLNLLFFYSFSVPQVMIFIACAIQIQWLRFVVHGFVVSAIASAYAKGSHNLLPFKKVILHIVKCVYMRVSIRGIGLNKSYHKPRGSYGILMPFCIFLRTMSLSQIYSYMSVYLGYNCDTNQISYYNLTP